MFGKRYDGRLVRTTEPMQRIMPFIMKTRTDSMNMYEDTTDCAGMDAYIKAKAAEGVKLTYMHILIASMVRLLAIRPQLNRFIMGGKIYTRPKIWVSFVVHPTMKDDSAGTTIKLCFEGTESILEIVDKINEAVAKETVIRTEKNATDKLLDTLTKLPSPILFATVNILMWMDRHNMLPTSVLKASPFHTSIFLTNLKSLGINHIYHHVYEFGTTGLFLAMGKERKVASVEGNSIVPQKHMGFGLVMDERFCDGLYFARSFRMMKKFLHNPALLEEKLEAKIEDIP